MKWTEEQQKVIDTRDRNILVSAAAGSGKTAVLVARILALVTDPAHPARTDPQREDHDDPQLLSPGIAKPFPHDRP